MKYYLSFCILFMSILAGWSQESTLKISLDVNDEDGILHGKNTVQAFLTIENSATSEIDLSIDWIILTDDVKPLKMLTLPNAINPNETLRSDCPLFRFPDYGFYRIQAKVRASNKETFSLEKTIGIDP